MSDVDELAQQPRWVQDLVLGSAEAKSRVVGHEAWRLMREGTIPLPQHRNLFVGFWPLIEKFPNFLALNLLKTTYGRDETLNAVRAWLARNLRVEARHAEWFLDWAEGLGVSREEMFAGAFPGEMLAITDWCWGVCQAGELAEALAATNYAVEGATGEWALGVARSEAYRGRLAAADIERTTRWLEAHATYDASHPEEAMALVARLLGADPRPARVRAIRHAVTKSYDLYRLALDVGLERAGGERS